MTQINPLNSTHSFKKSNLKESKTAPRHYFETPVNSRNSTDRHEILYMMTHFDRLKPSDGKNLDFRKQHGGRCMVMSTVDIGLLKATQQGTEPVRCRIPMGVRVRVHIGATWRIRLNRPCAAAMRPYVKLL